MLKTGDEGKSIMFYFMRSSHTFNKSDSCWLHLKFGFFICCCIFLYLVFRTASFCLTSFEAPRNGFPAQDFQAGLWSPVSPNCTALTLHVNYPHTDLYQPFWIYNTSVEWSILASSKVATVCQNGCPYCWQRHIDNSTQSLIASQSSRGTLCH